MAKPRDEEQEDEREDELSAAGLDRTEFPEKNPIEKRTHG